MCFWSVTISYQSTFQGLWLHSKRSLYNHISSMSTLDEEASIIIFSSSSKRAWCGAAWLFPLLLGFRSAWPEVVGGDFHGLPLPPVLLWHVFRSPSALKCCEEFAGPETRSKEEPNNLSSGPFQLQMGHDVHFINKQNTAGCAPELCCLLLFISSHPGKNPTKCYTKHWQTFVI